MRSLLIVSVTSGLLAGCASEGPAPAVAADAGCFTRETPLGSSVARSVKCAGSDAERESARQDAERLREEQNRRNQPRPGATSGR